MAPRLPLLGSAKPAKSELTTLDIALEGRKARSAGAAFANCTGRTLLSIENMI
jgi:hypothetical protein